MKFKRYDIFVRLGVLYTKNIYNHAQLIEPLWKYSKNHQKSLLGVNMKIHIII